MTVKNLFKRFMKESGFYGSPESKESLSFIDKYNDAFIPLNSFEWETSKQGYGYWHTKALDWVVYLYDSLDCVDEDDKKKYDLSKFSFGNCLYELTEEYSVSATDELSKNLSYVKAKNLYYKLYPQYKCNSISTTGWYSTTPYITPTITTTTTNALWATA